MPPILLIHWNAAEAAQRLDRLAAAGFAASAFSDQAGGSPKLRKLLDPPPAALLIDLSRLPSHGRAVALWMRENKATRGVPLVFVEGDPAKFARLRADLPDATYATWRGVKSALRHAIASPPSSPVVSKRPDYSGTPLAKKLGIKPQMTVAAVGGPDDFAATLEPLPDGVTLRPNLRGRTDLAVVFVTSRAELQRRAPEAQKALADPGTLWLAWPKKSSGVRTDLSEDVLREAVLPTGWVDYKVCAIDSTWSGLAFARRRTAQPRR